MKKFMKRWWLVMALYIIGLSTVAFLLLCDPEVGPAVFRWINSVTK